jgi:hypothetical protein
MADIKNLTKYSSDKISTPGGTSTTKYSSKGVLGKVGPSPRRAPKYEIENIKK